jgi:hypothetical protein
MCFAGFCRDHHPWKEAACFHCFAVLSHKVSSTQAEIFCTIGEVGKEVLLSETVYYLVSRQFLKSMNIRSFCIWEQVAHRSQWKEGRQNAYFKDAYLLLIMLCLKQYLIVGVGRKGPGKWRCDSSFGSFVCFLTVICSYSFSPLELFFLSLFSLL